MLVIIILLLSFITHEAAHVKQIFMRFS